VNFSIFTFCATMSVIYPNLDKHYRIRGYNVRKINALQLEITHQELS